MPAPIKPIHEQLNIYHFDEDDIQNGDFVKFYIRTRGTFRIGEIIRSGYGYVEDLFLQYGTRRYLYIRAIQKQKNGHYYPIIFTPQMKDIKVMNFINESERKKLI